MAKKRPVVAENVVDNMSAVDNKLASMFEKAAVSESKLPEAKTSNEEHDEDDAVQDVKPEMSLSDKINDLEKRNADLMSENEDLKSKIADYLIELDDLRKKKSNANAEQNVKIVELERKCKELEDASDKYLMRISELTFDNARLRASVQQLESDIQKQNVQTPSAPVPVARPKTRLERPIANPYSQNGYSSWN